MRPPAATTALLLPSSGCGGPTLGPWHTTVDDMAAAVRLPMAHISSQLGPRPIHMIGFSTGATLALDYALDATEGKVPPAPASIVQISPAIRVHPGAALVGDTGRAGLGEVSANPLFVSS